MDACSCYQDYNTRYQTTHSADSFILQTVQTPESDNKPPLLLELGRISKMSKKKTLDFVLHQKWPEYGPILLGFSFAV